jgi:hypothetical protein
MKDGWAGKTRLDFFFIFVNIRPWNWKIMSKGELNFPFFSCCRRRRRLTHLMMSLSGAQHNKQIRFAYRFDVEFTIAPSFLNFDTLFLFIGELFSFSPLSSGDDGWASCCTKNKRKEKKINGNSFHFTSNITFTAFDSQRMRIRRKKVSREVGHSGKSIIACLSLMVLKRGATGMGEENKLLLKRSEALSLHSPSHFHIN